MFRRKGIRFGLVGCLLGVLGGAPPLVGLGRTAQAAVRPPIIQPLVLGNQQARAHDDHDGHDHEGCSALTIECFTLQECQPVVIVKKIYVPVQVIRKVYVPVQVVKIVKVYVPVAATPTEAPSTTGATRVTVKVVVPNQTPAPTATPETAVIGDPGTPMF